MSNIQIVTDSTVYMPEELILKLNIKRVPLTVFFDHMSFEEGYPDSFLEYFKKLSESTEFPKTSQPASELFLKVFEDALNEGKEIITIVLSEQLSGTYNSAYAAAQMTIPERISIIDSECTAANLRALVEMAHMWAENGLSRQEIVDKLNEQKKRMRINLTVASLEYLKRGGRLTGVKAVIATVLNIRPILALVNGKLESIGKGRGKSKTIEMMIEDIPSDVIQLSVCYTSNYEEAVDLKTRLDQKFPKACIKIDCIGPVIGSHLGPGAIGICSYW